MMNITEEEAKTKWCPLARIAAIGSAGSVSANRVSDGKNIDTSRSLCIASECMAWCWDNRKVGHDPEYAGIAAAIKFTKDNPLRGHCGAFGK